MLNKPAQSTTDTLESLIDRYSLADVLEGLNTVCQDKAAHVRETWQDEALAREWEQKGTAMQRAQTAILRIEGR